VVHRLLAADLGDQPGGTYRLPRVLGAAIVNAGQMGGQPLTLALVLGIGVLISLSTAVVTSARRRRRELAVLQALGLTRGQLRSVIAWQTSTTLFIAVALGLPLGVVVGRWAWTGFAGSLGVVPVTVVPLGPVVLGLLLLVAVGTAITALPAVIATNTATASALRIE
jgi:ABC-type antimicrobial peptide transport system permease subunit